MVSANGKNAPAPWVPYTRAGCKFGAVASANTELENTLPDVPHVFGANSPQAREAENPQLQGKAAADFMGLAVHCARGSATCGTGARPDVLPGETGGYHGYRVRYGSKFVQPVISPSGPVRNLSGEVIKDSSGDIGFPGYNGMTGPNALSYTLGMQLHGIPVTFTYLSDMHESWVTGGPFGPGQAGYEAQLRAENAAFGTFFSRLAAHGITKANTLFVITADEGDHFVGGPATPAGCNGVTVTCHYTKVGEVNGNLTGLLGKAGISTPFDVEADSAPAIYVHGQPGRTTPAVRALDRAAARLAGDDLVTGRPVRLTRYLADPVELRLLHMVTGDPRRTPTVVLFGNDNFWLSGGSASCGSSCFTQPLRHRRLESRHGRPADQHHLAGPGWSRRGAPRHGQLGLVRSRQHPADHDGAAAAARRLRPGRPGAGRDHEPVRAAGRDARAPRHAGAARPGLYPDRGAGRRVRARHPARLDGSAGQLRQCHLYPDRKPAQAAGRRARRDRRPDARAAARRRVRRPAGDCSPGQGPYPPG